MARILIVDDSAYFRLKLKNILESSNHEVVGEAADGLKGAILYRQLQPDLVTMDISMPQVNGIEGVKTIIEKDPKAKIIMVSAMGQKFKVLDAMKYGAKHFIVKPIDPEALINIINVVMNGK